MRRSMRAAVAAGGDEDFRKAKEYGIHGGRRERSGGKFRAKQLKDQVFRQAQKIRLRALGVTRRILRYGAEQQADSFTAGFFHCAMDSAGGFFRGDAAGRFQWRRQARQQAQRGLQILDSWDLDWRIERFARRVAAVSDQRG